MGRKRCCYLYLLRKFLRNGIVLSVFLGSLLIVGLHRGCQDDVIIFSGLKVDVKEKRFTRESYNSRLIQQVNILDNNKSEVKQTSVKPTTLNPYELARNTYCSNLSLHPKNASKISPIAVRWSRRNDVMYCPIYKIGTTFWRRVFMIQRERQYRHLRNPFEIPFDKEYKASVFGINDEIQRSNSFKFMFVRNPYARLYSTYVDKLFAPNPVFWKAIGQSAIKLSRPNAQKNSVLCGHDVTFPEFIKYVIYSLEHNHKVDPHFVPMETNCHSCQVTYDFIGKMENFDEDSFFILKKLALNETIRLLEKKGHILAADDAIRDTLKQPFYFRQKYIHCMSFHSAIKRAWTKLKLRGLIGNDTLDYEFLKNNGATFTKIVDLARSSRSRSNSADRQKMKEKVYKEHWDKVPLTDKIRLRALYAADFLLFNYDDTPSELFARKT